MDGWEWMDGLDSTSSVDEILGIYEWKGTWPLMDVTRSWARGVSEDDSVVE